MCADTAPLICLPSAHFLMLLFRPALLSAVEKKQHVLTVQCYTLAQHRCSNYNSWYSQFLFRAGVFELYNMRRNLLHTLQALQRAIDLGNPQQMKGRARGRTLTVQYRNID